MIIIQKLFVFFAWIIAHLPFRLLYLKSYFFYYILYYLVQYRKKVVFKNLHQAFPDKNNDEIKAIARKFYHNLCDLFFEVLKLKTISPENLKRRFKIKNPEILDKLYNDKKSILVTLGHIGNWEWLGPLLSCSTQFKVFGPAKPLQDPFFNQFMNSNRSRFGFVPVNFTYTLRTLLNHKNEQTASIMAADQNPVKNDQNYWAPFLNKETSFFMGIEKIAKSLDMAVVYIDIQRAKRGYYEAELKMITDQPKKCREYEIIDSYIQHLETSIIKNPDNWLWSHRRWKYEKDTITN